jgi:molybdenum cofactor cytidylyltransferase
MSGKVGALVLAAGFSHRFGSVKLCASLDNGKTVFEQTLERLQQAVADVVVVTRPELAEPLIQVCDSLEIFDQAEKGMGATLAYGISLISDWDAVLICLADMPFITAETYGQLARVQQADRITVPEYQGRQGNPVGFGRKFFAELGSLGGDKGGRAIMQHYPEALDSISVEDAAILHDIDTPEDLRRLQSEAVG